MPTILTVLLLKTFVHLFIFSLLTVLTQVGGLVYLLNFATYGLMNRQIGNRWMRRFSKWATFSLLYGLTTFFIVPFIAEPFGRVPLPITNTHHLQPLTVWTCILNRHYVTPTLRNLRWKWRNKCTNNTRAPRLTIWMPTSRFSITSFDSPPQPQRR